jgi:hypothetical protein
MQRLYIIYLVQLHRELVSTINSQNKWFLTIDCLPNSPFLTQHRLNAALPLTALSTLQPVFLIPAAIPLIVNSAPLSNSPLL